MARPLRYSCEFTIRVTGDEREQLRRRARSARLSLSRYLVEAALADRPLSREDRAQRDRALFHLRKVGVNLNQLTRRINNNAAISPKSLEETLPAVTAAAEQLSVPRGVPVPGVFIRFSIGRAGMSGANVRYITRGSATDFDREAVVARNYPDHAREGEDYRDSREHLEEFARQREEDELERPHHGGAGTRAPTAERFCHSRGRSIRTRPVPWQTNT